jgi:RND family efflux transporter MFP subunit
LVADEATIIGAKVAGRVATAEVDLGDFVREGDVLARLEDADLKLLVAQAEAQLAQARAGVGLTGDQSEETIQRENSPVVRQERAVLDEAKANLARLKLLDEQKAATRADLEAAAALVAVSEARFASSLNAVEEKLATIRLRRAEWQLTRENLEHAVIRAPFDGLIQARQAAAGSYLRVGDPVVTLVRIDPLRYRGTVPERLALQLRNGQEVRVKLDGVAEPLVTRVARISPALDEMSRALVFEADIPNADGRLRSGLFAEAEVVIDADSPGLAVPATSVFEFAGVQKVWRVREGAALEVEVTTGRREQGVIEIVAGLKAGDQVIRRGSEGRAGPVIAAAEPEHVGGS